MNQGNTGVRHEGQVDSRNDSGIFNVTAYNGFGKPASQAVYVNVAFEYMINTLKNFYYGACHVLLSMEMEIFAKKGRNTQI